VQGAQQSCNLSWRFVNQQDVRDPHPAQA